MPFDADTDGSLDAPTSDLGPADSPPEGVPPVVSGCPADSALRLCFTFDEGSGTAVKDGSGNGNNGTTDAMWVAGVGGTALHFDGKQTVAVATSPTLTLGTSDFTIAAWIWTAGKTAHLLNKRSGCGHGSFWEIALSPGGQIALTVDQDASGTNFKQLIGKTSLSDSRWHHVAATRSGTTLRIYIDGLLDAEASSAAVARIDGTAPLRVATGPCVGVDGSTSFVGTIDVVRIYGRAKTTGEVCADANRTWTGSACGGGTDAGTDAMEAKPETPPCGTGTEVCGKMPCVRTCKDTIDCAEMCMTCSEIDGCKALLTDAAEKKKADDYWTCACSTCFDTCMDMAACMTCVCTELCTSGGKCAAVGKACFGGTDPKTSNPECVFWGC